METAGHVYMDFVPSHEWLQDDAADTLIVHVPGFVKDHLRVHVGRDGKLIVSGERPLIKDRWSRFRKEFQLPENCKSDQISAKFENGLLTIVLPKPQRHRGAATEQKEKGGAKETEGDAHGRGGTGKAVAEAVAVGNQASRTAAAAQGEEAPSDEQKKLTSTVSMDVRLQPHEGRVWVVALLVAVAVLAWYLYQKLNPEETHRHGARPAI